MAGMAHCKLNTCFLPSQSTLSFSETLWSPSISFNAANSHCDRNRRQKLCMVAAVEAPPSITKAPRPSPSPVRPAVKKKKGRTLLSRDSKPRPRRTILGGIRDAILRPPLDDTRLADKFLRSPQLAIKTLPLLSSCLPFAALQAEDEEWMQEHMPEIKAAMGYPLPNMETVPTSPDAPLYHLDTLIYLAFQHLESPRGNKKYLRIGHSRLAFLGQYIVELSLAEYFLIRYPRETPACMRERVFALTNMKAIPKWIKAATLDGPIFPGGLDSVRTIRRLQTLRGVFWALVAALYLCMGMGEVYRFFFEVLGMDPEDASCQPKRRIGRADVDYVYGPLEEKQMEWQDLATTKTEDDALFAKPLLYRACVPPGMQRFRGNLWEIDSLPQVLRALGYPLPTIDEDAAITRARNTELELGLQLVFTHPSVYKREHPRFCNERFEYLGSKIQDVVMAEKLLMKHLDAPGFYIAEKHRRLLFNRVCGKYFREKKLQKFMMLSDPRKEVFDKSRKLRSFASTGASLALHGLGYAVYGRAEVRRIMFELLDFERLQAPPG